MRARPALCYPEIFMRECWERVTVVPWWSVFSQDIEMAIQIHRDLLAVTGEDRVRIWMSIPRSDLVVLGVSVGLRRPWGFRYAPTP